MTMGQISITPEHIHRHKRQHKPNDNIMNENDEQKGQDSGCDTAACYAKFVRLQAVKFPLGDGTYQECKFIGVDSEGVATVKTKGGRYRTVWECNLYSA